MEYKFAEITMKIVNEKELKLNARRDNRVHSNKIKEVID